MLHQTERPSNVRTAVGRARSTQQLSHSRLLWPLDDDLELGTAPRQRDSVVGAAMVPTVVEEIAALRCVSVAEETALWVWAPTEGQAPAAVVAAHGGGHAAARAATHR